MASLATIASVAAIGAAVVGTGVSLYGASVSAENSRKAGEAERQTQLMLAQQEEAAGTEAFASAQREAKERKLEGELIMSRQQAVAAASGGGASTDAPTIVRLMTETAKRSKLGQDSVIYTGESTRSRYNTSAAARRISGENSFLGGIQGAQGAWLSGLGSLAAGVGKVGGLVRDF
jgi:hypothetical protein